MSDVRNDLNCLLLTDFAVVLMQNQKCAIVEILAGLKSDPNNKCIKICITQIINL